MKRADIGMKRLLYVFLFFAWSLFLLFLIAGKGYMAFLRPEFGVFLAIALFIAGGYMITAVFRFSTQGVNMSVVSRTLVLLIPILYCIAAKDSILGSQAFMQRYTGSFGQESRYSNLSGNTENDPDKKETILDIYLKPDLFRGKHVSVMGMIIHDEELKQHFDGKKTAVYRFLINCCAADAVPLAVALDGEDLENLKGDQWVLVEGVFDIGTVKDEKYPVILKPVITPVETPAFPYLY